MNQKNTEKLFKDFSSFWYEPNDPSKSLMVFGFECGDGWFPLIYKLCADIQKEIKENNLENFYVVQVKEKFGGLRFYTYNSTEKIEELIRSAMKQSFHTCEDCGGYFKNRPKTTNWTYALCPKCWKKLQKSRSNTPINIRLNK